MDINYLLTWIVSISCITQIIYGIRSSSRQAVVGWIVVSGFILTVTAILSYFAPNIAGLVGGGLWAVLMVTPAIAIRNVNQLLTQQKFRLRSAQSCVVNWSQLLYCWYGTAAVLTCPVHWFCSAEPGMRRKMNEH